ncbi:hypothetical protein ADMFC3_00450 [Geovibrio sp. ADMFC3]
MNKYLINEPPLFVLPTLAQKIGLNEAILVQQLHFWLLRSKNEKAGHRWVYNTYDDWLEQFPFWSKSTLRRTVEHLENKGIVVSTLEFNRDINKTKWYRLDYSVLASITGEQEHSEYLINEPPLVVLPTLAVNYGLNEAMFLQQLHFFQSFTEKEADGYKWIAKPYQVWLSQFSFWTDFILSKVIKNLTDKNLIINTDKYSSRMMKTKWLRINYENVTPISYPNLEQSYLNPEQTYPNPEQTYLNPEQTYPNPEQSYLNPEQTYPNLEQSYPNPEQIVPEKRADSTLNMSSLYIGSDYNPDYKTDYDRSAFKEIHDEVHLDETEIEAHTNSAVELFRKYCVNGRDVHKITNTLKTLVKEALDKHGQEAIKLIFEEVKRSDYLLGHGGVKTSLSWIIKNSDSVLSGKYTSRGDSLYEAAQKCNAANFTCKPTTESKKESEMCVHCQRWNNRPKPEQPKEKTLAEVAMDCFKNTENSKHKEFQCPVLGKRDLRHEYCAFCPRQEDYLKKEAAECFASCGGTCATTIFKAEARECCRFCPKDGNDPDKNKKKPEDKNSEEILKADFRDNNEVWQEAHKWTIKNRRTISGFIAKYIPYLALDEEELEAEALIVAFETLAPLVAELPEVPEKQFAAKFWNNLKYRFRQMKSIPSVGEVTNTDNRTACTMVDFNEIESYTDFKDPVDTEEPEAARKLRTLMGILTLEEEEIIEHRELGLKHGKLTALETAVAMGISYDRQRKLEKSANQKIADFIKKYRIKSDTAVETIEKHVAAEAQSIFKPLKSPAYFELGYLLKKII